MKVSNPYNDSPVVLPKNVICFPVRNDEKECCGLISCDTTSGEVVLTPHPRYEFSQVTEDYLIKMVKLFWKNTYSSSGIVRS